MNREPLYNKQGLPPFDAMPMMMQRDTDADERVVHVRQASLSNSILTTTDIDLESNYQNAVDCLVHCEYIIKSLQEQLAEKDEHISSLEERLVQMSLELASAKAKQDEQRQELLHQYRCKHQVDGYSNSNNHQDMNIASAAAADDQDVLEQLQAAVNKAIQDDPSIQVAVNKATQNDPSIGASSKILSVGRGYAPISFRARGKHNTSTANASRHNNKTTSTRRSSEDEDVGFMSWPSPQEQSNCTNEAVRHPRPPLTNTNDGATTTTSTTSSSHQIKRHQRPERRGGFSMRALSKHFTTWNDNDNDCTATTHMPKSTVDVTSSFSSAAYLDDSRASTALDDSSTRSGLTDSAKESAHSSVLSSSGTTSKILNCSSFHNTHTNNGLENKDSSSSALSARHTRYSRSSSNTQAPDTTTRHTNLQSSNALDYETTAVAPPPRRLSNLGNLGQISQRFLGGFNNNNNNSHHSPATTQGFNNSTSTNGHSQATTTTTTTKKKKNGLSTSLLSSTSQHNSVGSILSELSGVVFPVSSDDCLRGLERRITKKSDDCLRGLEQRRRITKKVTPCAAADVYNPSSRVVDGGSGSTKKKGHGRSSSMDTGIVQQGYYNVHVSSASRQDCCNVVGSNANMDWPDFVVR